MTEQLEHRLENKPRMLSDGGSPPFSLPQVIRKELWVELKLLRWTWSDTEAEALDGRVNVEEQTAATRPSGF